MTGRAVSAYDDDAVGTLDAVGLTEAIAARQVSIPEVVEATIARVERVAPALNPLAYVLFDRARADARRPRGGFFAGVPTVVKDNCDLAGAPTQQGGDAFAARPARADGDLARMLLATGLVPLGKSQMSEYGFSGVAEHPRLGAVRNPWDPAVTAGASSAGAAALVASGALTIAHANDGGGSIRIPAAVCGLVGLKPTRGRLAQDRLLREMPVRIVSDGVLTRTVRDTAAFLREAERVYRPLHLPPVGDVTPLGRTGRGRLGRLRVAVHVEGIGHGASPEVAELTMKTAALLEELGHDVELAPIPAPASFPEDFLTYWSLIAWSLVRRGRLQHGRSWDASRLDRLTLGLARRCERHPHRVPGAIRRLRRARADSERFHATYDVVLTPTLATESPRVGWLDPTQDYDLLVERLLEWVTFTPWQNVTGDPALSLPLATTASGLPQGMMLGAAAGHEALLLELAYELEEAVPFPRIGP